MTNSQNNSGVGVWERFDGLTPENVHALHVFQKATGSLIGATHQTLGRYYTQNVKGTNYAFEASCTVVGEEKSTHEWVYVYEDLHGEITLVDFKANAPSPSGDFGGWKLHNGLTPQNVNALDVYEKAQGTIIGVNHRTTGIYYTQLVSRSINYAFASERAPVVPNPHYTPEWVYTNESFDGVVEPAQFKTAPPVKESEVVIA